METLHLNIASDCYYSASLENCNDCIFSFNQKNRHFLIGNLQMEKDAYNALKDKLLAEIRDTLQRDKSVISIAELIAGGEEGAGVGRTGGDGQTGTGPERGGAHG